MVTVLAPKINCGKCIVAASRLFSFVDLAKAEFSKGEIPLGFDHFRGSRA